MYNGGNESAFQPESWAKMAHLSIRVLGPFQVVALGAPEVQAPVVPLLQDRGFVDGQAAVYVCRDFKCQAPVAEPGRLLAQLE
jgi:uncharacterized protein YyaL (SSP411 family)